VSTAGSSAPGGVVCAGTNSRRIDMFNDEGLGDAMRESAAREEAGKAIEVSVTLGKRIAACEEMLNATNTLLLEITRSIDILNQRTKDLLNYTGLEQ